ncbi:MAG: hypothetical protein ACR2O8_17645 [Rhizobiaceae bacterium]
MAIFPPLSAELLVGSDQTATGPAEQVSLEAAASGLENLAAGKTLTGAPDPDEDVQFNWMRNISVGSFNGGR